MRIKIAASFIVIALLLGIGYAASVQGQGTSSGDATPTSCASPIASPDASPASSPAATPSDNACATPESGGAVTAIEIDAFDLGFKPNAITIPANTDVTVTFKNTGFLPHDFSIDALSISTGSINGGQETSVTINASAGTYQFYCNVPGHKDAGMVGVLTVK